MSPEEFGQLLKRMRKEKKLTVRQLDLYSGVSHSYISQIEQGKRGIPSPEILKKLSKPLGVTYEELLEKAGYIDNELSKFENLEELLKETVIKFHESVINDPESFRDNFVEATGEEEFEEFLAIPPEKLPEYLEFETKVALLTHLGSGDDITYEQFFEALQIPYKLKKLNEINEIDISNIDAFKNLKLSYDGMELTEEEKMEFVSLVQAFFSSRRALRQKQ